MRRSIRRKIIVSILALTLSSTILLSALSFFTSKWILQEELFARFESIRAWKQYEVVYYVDHLRKHALMLTQNAWYAEEVANLSDAFEKLRPGKLTDAQRGALENYYRTEVMTPLSKLSSEPLKLDSLYPSTDLGQFLQFHHLVSGNNSENPRNQEFADFESSFANLRSKLQDMARTLDFLDIRIVHPKTGITILSLEPGIDYGVSLFEGDLAKTRLSEAVRNLVSNPESSKARLVDFERYVPLRYKPSAFLVCPIFDEKELAGIAVFRLSNERFDDIVNTDETRSPLSLGRTGEIFLVGEDTMMRTESRFFLENRSKYLEVLHTSGMAPGVIQDIERYETTVLTVPRQANAVRTIFEKGAFTWTPVGYLGERVIASNAPLELDDVRWGIVALIQEEEAYLPIRKLGSWLIALTSGILSIAAILSIWLGGSLVEPIERMTMAARSLGSGFKDVRVKVDTGDELETLGHTFNEMAEGVEKERAGNRKTNYENECLLETMMPPDVISRLWGGPHVAEGTGFHGEVTVSYSRIHGIKSMYKRIEPDIAIGLMESLHEMIEEAAGKYGIRTLANGGGSCFAISGLEDLPDPGTCEMVRFANDLIHILRKFDEGNHTNLSVTSGINSGPISSGTIGHQEFFRSLWRPTMKAVDLKSDSTRDAENQIVVTQQAFMNIEGRIPGLETGNEFHIAEGQSCRKVWLMSGPDPH
ncbi:HAMP domain-containing protein [bacterium]|nr:HAMP domain-containing protein [bacterium]